KYCSKSNAYRFLIWSMHILDRPGNGMFLTLPRSHSDALSGPFQTTRLETRMKASTKARLLVALCAALVGTAVSPLAFADGKPAELTVSAKQYKQYFREASNEFNVPVELLQSIAYAETRWHPHVPKGKLKKNGEPEVEVESHEG